MDSMGLPAAVLLYIAGATSVTGILVNGIRTAVALPPIVSFIGACVLGFIFVVLFAVANGVDMTGPLWAASVIAGVMVGGASAGANAVHSRSLPAGTAPADAPPPSTAPTAREVALEIERVRQEERMKRLHVQPPDPPTAVGTDPLPGFMAGDQGAR